MYGKASFIMLNTTVCWSSMWMISNLQDPRQTWTKHGPASSVLSTLVTPNLMIGILGVNMWSSTMLHFHEKPILLLMFLNLNPLLLHSLNIAQMIFGNMTPSIKLGHGIISSHARSCSSLAMRGGSLPSHFMQNGLQCSTKMLNLRVFQFSTCIFQMRSQRSLRTT